MSSRNSPNRSDDMRLRSPVLSISPVRESVAAASENAGASASGVSVGAHAPSNTVAPIVPATSRDMAFFLIVFPPSIRICSL